MKPLLYWHTLRHLKWTQVTSRLRRRYLRLNLVCPTDARPRTLSNPIGADPWRACALDERGALEFLNERRSLPDVGGWNAPGVAKLWLYNLHYFDWINSVGRTSAAVSFDARALGWMQRWIDENPPPFGNGWEPYPISQRIVNWIKWLSRGPAISKSKVASIAQSLVLQAHVLSQRLETHLLGNHLFENAKALVFAGSFFEGESADRWFERGSRILDEELNEQILEDGGYFELSPMYHAIIVEGLLDLLSLQYARPSARWAEHGLSRERLADKARAMLRWLGYMSHPDGHIALFNDAAFGIAPDLATLQAYASARGLTMQLDQPRKGVHRLQASGFVRVDRGNSVAILDVGRVGPEYLPGHAHADTLSFEWSLGCERVIVDTGTSLYAAGAERTRQRGTAAHNTVVVDGADSSEVWGQFRVARRAYLLDVQVDTSLKQWTIDAAHDGYRRLPGNVIHRRRWSIGAHTLTVLDRLEGRYADAQARFHFHPGVRIENESTGTLRLSLPGGQRILMRVSRGRAFIEDSSYHPEFGRSIPNRCVAVALDGGAANVNFEF